MTNGPGKSDRPTVPGKSPNNARQPAAEGMEGKGLAKGNLLEQNASRTPSRKDAPSALERVRQAAKKDKQLRFTALLHHIYNPETLRVAYFSLKKEAAPGVDGETWRHYGEELERNLQNLSERLKRGAYRAKPVRRVYIAKTDGRQRPLGVPVLEDKIVQRATVEVLNAIYETDFLGFSYGFRPGRSQHQALDALYTGLLTRKVNWVLDLDIKSFFDGLSHEWLVKFIEHRVADRRVVRLIQKWLNAGVLEDGTRTWSDKGTPQGGSISPLLANVYLHYAFDLWVRRWRKTQAHGDMIVVRYADDFIGCTHICGKKRNGRFTVVRQTSRKRLQAKLSEVKAELRRRLHGPIPEVGAWLRAVIIGHLKYYGVPMNRPALFTFCSQVGWLWYRALRRRSQTARLTWERMRRLIQRWLPPPRITHPYPLRRLGVVT